MKAASFNRIYDDLVAEKLKEHGYISKGQSLFLTKEATTAALLRSTFRGEQGSAFIYCLRHNFLRDRVKLTTDNTCLKDEIDYPFRFKISEFSECDLKHVTYTPINYHKAYAEIRYDSIYYGDTDEEDIKEITDQLKLMTDNTIKYGSQIMNLLTPRDAYDYLLKNNKGAWIEKVWMKDYNNYLQEPVH